MLRLLPALALAAAMSTPAQAQGPLSLTDVLTILQFNEGPEDMMDQVRVAMVRKNCVSFKLTREAVERMRAVGAGAAHRLPNSFVDAIRGCLTPEESYAEGLMWLEGSSQWYAMSTQAFEHAANRGHAAAAYRVGLAHENRWAGHAQPVPVGADSAAFYRAALRWFHIAAERGYAVAMNGIARYHREGHGVPRDYAEARRWLQKGADTGFGRSMVQMGYMHRNGQGTPVDHAEAFRWFQMAAEAGDVYGNVHMAEAYDEGKGVRRNRNQARAQWRIVLERGLDQEMRDVAARRLR